MSLVFQRVHPVGFHGNAYICLHCRLTWHPGECDAFSVLQAKGHSWWWCCILYCAQAMGAKALWTITDYHTCIKFWLKMLKDCDVLVHKEKNMILSFQPSFLWQAACNWTEPVPDCSVPLRAIVWSGLLSLQQLTGMKNPKYTSIIFDMSSSWKCSDSCICGRAKLFLVAVIRKRNILWKILL